MLFHSDIFIFPFLPLTLVVFYTIGGRGHHRIAVSWLVAFNQVRLERVAGAGPKQGKLR